MQCTGFSRLDIDDKGGRPMINHDRMPSERPSQQRQPSAAFSSLSNAARGGLFQVHPPPTPPHTHTLCADVHWRRHARPPQPLHSQRHRPIGRRQRRRRWLLIRTPKRCQRSQLARDECNIFEQMTQSHFCCRSTCARRHKM